MRISNKPSFLIFIALCSCNKDRISDLEKRVDEQRFLVEQKLVGIYPKEQKTSVRIRSSALHKVIESLNKIDQDSKKISGLTIKREGNLYSFRKDVRFYPDPNGRIGLEYDNSGRANLMVGSIQTKFEDDNRISGNVSLRGNCSAQLSGHIDIGPGGGNGFSVEVSGKVSGEVPFKASFVGSTHKHLVVALETERSKFSAVATAGLGHLGDLNVPFNFQIGSIKLPEIKVAYPVSNHVNISIFGDQIRGNIKFSNNQFLLAEKEIIVESDISIEIQ